jgi:hypothetical protein
MGRLLEFKIERPRRCGIIIFNDLFALAAEHRHKHTFVFILFFLSLFYSLGRQMRLAADIDDKSISSELH